MKLCGHLVLWGVLVGCASTATFERAKTMLARGDTTEAAFANVSQFAPDQQAALLRIALRRDSPGLLQRLLAHGIDVDARSRPGRATALMYASYANKLSLVASLVGAGADLNLVDANGDPAINWAVYAGHRGVTEFLLRKGADITLSGHGNAWQIALRRGDYELAVSLCRAGNWRPRLTVAEARALAALEHGDLEAFKRLRARIQGALLDRAGRPVLLRAAELGRVAFVQWLVSRGDAVDQADPIGFTALMEAAREGHVALVRDLLVRGAYVRAQAKPAALSFEPVHLAALGDEPEILRALVEAGADINVVDTDGTPPLVWALYEQRDKAARWLIAHGADQSLRNKFGDTAASLLAQRR